MCNCHKDIESKLLARFKDQVPQSKYHVARLSGYTLIIKDSGIVEKGCMPIELAADHPLKKGGYKHKVERSNMIFTYCPFCGEKYEKEGAA